MPFAALFAVAALSSQTLDLSWHPKEGQATKYALTMKLSLFGDQATYTSVVTETVKKVTDKIVTVEFSQSDYKVVLFGEEAAVQDKDLPKYEADYSPAGELVELRSDLTDSNAYRTASLWAIRRPASAVKAGDTWTAALKANADRGLPAITAAYKVVGPESDSTKVTVDYKETEGAAPATAVGWLLLDGSGGLMQSEMTWTNAPIPGLSQPAGGTVSYKRI